MIQFIHEDIYNKKEKESLVNNLLEMTLIYLKNTHIYIYTSDNNPKYFQGSGGGGIASPSTNSISFYCKTRYIKSCLDVGWL